MKTPPSSMLAEANNAMSTTFNVRIVYFFLMDDDDDDDQKSEGEIMCRLCAIVHGILV